MEKIREANASDINVASQIAENFTSTASLTAAADGDLTLWRDAMRRELIKIQKYHRKLRHFARRMDRTFHRRLRDVFGGF